MLTLLVIMLMARFRKWQLHRELKWQDILRKKGVGFRTRIEKITENNPFVNGYKKIVFESKVRINGKTICRKMHTLIGINEALCIGDKVLIRYRPGHAAHVLIGNKVV